MSDSFGVHAANEAQIIDVLGHVREQFRGPAAGLAVLPESPQRFHHAVLHDLASFGQRARVVKLTHLPIKLVERRLVIERVHMADTARHEEKNDSLRPHHMMSQSRRQGICRCTGLLSKSRQREMAEATSDGLESTTTGADIVSHLISLLLGSVLQNDPIQFIHHMRHSTTSPWRTMTKPFSPRSSSHELPPVS